MKEFTNAKETMIKYHLKARGIKDKKVLKAMKEVPREIFIPGNLASRAYNDNPLPIGEGQTISQPYMVAMMTEKLLLTGKEKVLEIGTGSGYQTAIMAHLAGHVYTIERIPELTEKAEINLQKLDITNVSLFTGDGTCGWKEHAPYDRIIVTAGAPSIPDPLIKQLANNGLLVIPVGNSYMQVLKIVKKIKNKIKIENSTGCVFVKLIGKYG